MSQQTDVRKTYSLILPINLVERIKEAARKQAIDECRHVPYSAVIRATLEQRFPARQAATTQE
jgi:hypothetical protein